MMTSVLMGAGLCDFQLDPDTPTAIKELFPTKATGTDLWRTHIVFTAHDMLDAPEAGQGIASHPSCVWCGPVWSRGAKGTRFSGPHMTGWLGNDRAGPGFNDWHTDHPSWPATISQVVQHWFPLSGAMAGIRYRNSASPPSTSIAGLEQNTYAPPLKPALDQLMAMVGCEYNVTHDARIDWGNATDLYSLAGPSVVCAEGAGSSRTYRVLNCTPSPERPDLGIDVEEHIYGYRDGAKIQMSDDSVRSVGNGSGVDLRHFYNGAEPVFYGDPEAVDIFDVNDFVAYVDAYVQQYAFPHREITVTCDDYCVPALVSTGNSVYCHSPDDFVEDSSVSIEIGDETLHPENLRITQMQAPFQSGMGAYAIVWNGSAYETHRVTDYVLPEDDQRTRLTLGSRPAPFVPPPTFQTLRSNG
jgi:hypothetical protein